MSDTPLGVVLGSVVFFWNLNRDLLKASKAYLAQAEVQEALMSFPTNGVGINQSIQSLAVTLPSLSKSPKSMFGNSSRFLISK